MEDERIELTLPAEAASVRAARDAVSRLSALETEDRDRIYDLLLLTSELVGNAIRHGSAEGDTIGVVVEAARSRIRVSVDDAANRRSVPQVLGRDPERPSGRGLYFVESIADRWGDGIVDGRNRVWFELDLAGAESHAPDRSLSSSI